MEFSDVIVERFARAWASIDGKAERFDQERGRDYLEDDNTGTFVGYMAEARELLIRANCQVQPAGDVSKQDNAIARYQGYMRDLQTLIGRAHDRGSCDMADLMYWASLIDSCLPPQPSSTPNT